MLALIVRPAHGQADWNLPQAPFQIFANTYYVGTRGLSVILIASDDGHVLIDAAVPESAGLIASNVRALGFKVEDIRLILNSHAHFDHAGAIAELQRLPVAGATNLPISESSLLQQSANLAIRQSSNS